MEFGPGAPGDVVVGEVTRDWFTGWIAGLGTDSGYRVVVGTAPRSPTW